MIFVTIYILNSQWGQLEEERLTIYIYYIILGVSGVSFTTWIAIDGKLLERYAAHIKKLEEKLVAQKSGS